ncbi:MAG: hypothetical protein IPO81_26590 [Kouleothrix sp.]|nr:hypothetical protein [Kouleothrix sp.]
MIITGANQGGKSTFFAKHWFGQFMMQCGMFVPAESFFQRPRRPVHALQTEEDASMEQREARRRTQQNERDRRHHHANALGAV